MLVWLVHASPRLSANARKILEDPTVDLAMPLIVAGELHDLHRRGKLSLSLYEVIDKLRTGRRCELIPMTEELLRFVPAGLEIHDSWIAATALSLQQGQPGESFPVLTSDPELHRLQTIQTIW